MLISPYKANLTHAIYSLNFQYLKNLDYWTFAVTKLITTKVVNIEVNSVMVCAKCILE